MNDSLTVRDLHPGETEPARLFLSQMAGAIALAMSNLLLA